MTGGPIGRPESGFERKPHARVKGKPPWPEMRPFVEASAAYLLTMHDKVSRTWGDRPRPVPPGALNVNRIREGLGIDFDDVEMREKHYLELRRDKAHFVNPQEEEGVPPQLRAACFALTDEGETWANGLLQQAQAGQKAWRPEWLEAPR